MKKFQWKKGDIRIIRGALDTFALRGTGTPGRKPAVIQAVNDYQTELQKIYSDWSDTLADDLADADPSEHDDIIKKALAALLLLLRNAGRTVLPDAVELGLDGDPHNPDVLKLLSNAMEENDGYLEDGLIPDIDAKLRQGLSGQDILEAIAAGSGAAAILGLLNQFLGRVESYSGEMWDVYNRTVGDVADEHGNRIFWRLDHDYDGHHCDQCLEFGDKVYSSYADLLEQSGGVTPANGTDCGQWDKCELIELETGEEPPI